MRSLYDFVIQPVGGRYNNVKKVGNTFSTLSNVHLLIEVDDVLNTDGMRITNMYIDRESIYELIKEIQGRKGFPAQLG